MTAAAAFCTPYTARYMAYQELSLSSWLCFALFTSTPAGPVVDPGILCCVRWQFPLRSRNANLQGPSLDGPRIATRGGADPLSTHERRWICGGVLCLRLMGRPSSV